MKLINDFEKLDELLKRYFIKNTITNHYVLPGSYSQYIADKQLYYFTTESNACIFVKKPDFYQLYYLINDHNELMNFVTDKPVTMEILYRGEAQRPYHVFAFWEKCGFRQHLTRDNMMVSYKQISAKLEYSPTVEIKFAASETEFAYTKDLLEKSLDRYTGNILSYEEIRAFAANKNILCALWEGNLCGALQFEVKNNVVWLGHIAVDPDFRGNGIANELVKAYILYNATQPETRYQLWVIQENIRATTLYRKFGFVYGNKSSASMLRT